MENQIHKKREYKNVFTKKTMKEVQIKPMDIVVLSNTIL